ncbi:MAG: transposase [Desulfomonilia bacterium]|jgi:transposase
MMGRQESPQEKLFSYHVNLSDRVRRDHPLRKVVKFINFDFIYDEVKGSYGQNGNVSVPPPVILKMMFLLFFYDVRSERELMETIPERLDWLWFLGYDLDDEIPDHSVLSKARARWGVDGFKMFFERIVMQCIDAGLVEGSKLFIDASLIDANASNNSVVDQHSLKRYLNKSYLRLEESLEDTDAKKTPVNSRHISTTDPDASVSRYSSGKPKLRYKTHRCVDQKSEIITVTKITTGSVDDGKMFTEMVEKHEDMVKADIVVAVGDSKYGTTENYLFCYDRKIKGHMASLEKTQEGTGRRKGIFSKGAFGYDPHSDTYTCPAGQKLRRRHYYKKKNQYEYRADKGACAQCPLRDNCTRAKDGRSLKRHLRQDELDYLRMEASSTRAMRDIKKRQDLSERSFAWSTRYGYKRARWRRLWRMEIQDFLIAAVQNISILIRQKPLKKADVRSENRPMKASADRINALYCRIFSFLHNYSDSRRFSAANYPKMLT